MPLISPDFGEEVRPEPTPYVPSADNNERIRRFLDCPTWKCSVCTSTVFGRCKKCPYCYGKHNKVTPRPEDYMEPPL